MVPQATLVSALLLLLPGLDGAALVFNRRFGGTSLDSARAVTTDRDGNIYVAGATSSLNFPVTGGLQRRNGGATPLVSADGGKSWNRASMEAAVYAVIPVGAFLYAGTSNGVYRSSDGARTFTRLSPEINYTVDALRADPRAPGRLVAASARGILISDDGGASWRESNQGITWRFGAPVVGATALASPPGRPEVLFAAVIDGGSVYRSIDSGATWTRLELGPAPLAVWSVAADSTNPDVLYAGVVRAGVFKTSDGGQTWRSVANINLNAGPHTIATAAGSVYAARIDGVSRSTDDGESWSNAGLDGRNVTAVAADPRDGSVAWALASGAIYRTSDGGETWEPVGPPVSPSLQNITILDRTVLVSGDPGQDAFLTKWDPTGSRILFSTYLGGSSVDGASGIALDGTGNIWIAGTTSSPDFPVTNQSRLSGDGNAFLAQISADGSKLLFATYLGGSTWDSASALAVDASGAVYLAGYTESADFPVTAGAAQAVYQAGCPNTTNTTNHGDAFVARLRNDGSVAYATFLGGSCGDAASGIAVDAQGNAYVVGFTNSPDFPVTDGAMQTQYGGGPYDGFVAKLDGSGGALVYATYLGDNQAGNVSAVAVDSAGAAYVTGNSGLFSPPSQSSGCGAFAVILGSHGLPWIVNSGAFVAKLKPDGSGREFGQLVGGDCTARAASIALDSSGKIWLGGYANGNFPMVAPVQALGLGSGFLAETDSSGTALLFSSLVDGAAQITLDRPGNVLAVGDTPLGDNPKELLGGQSRAPSAVVTKIDPARSFALRLDAPARPNQSPWFDFFGRLPGAAPGQLLRMTGVGFPDSLEGVEVRFDGRPAPLLSAAPTGILCSVPFGVAGQQASTVQVAYNGAVSNPVGIAIVPVALEALAVANADGSVNSYDNPARAGAAVTVYVSGMGLTEPPGVDGLPNPGPGRMLHPLTATLDNNVPAEILYAGPAPGLVAGVGQINVALPASLRPGALSLQLSSGQSQEFVTVNVE